MTPHTLSGLLAGTPAVGLAFLYGSLARGAARPDSDLDLAVMGAAPLSAGDLLHLAETLGQASGRPADVLDLRTAHGTILHEILRTGVRVFESDPALYPALLTRHLSEEADFRPLRDRILAQRRLEWTRA